MTVFRNHAAWLGAAFCWLALLSLRVVAGPADAASPAIGATVALPDDVRPVHVVAELTVDPRTERLQGDVRIEIELARPLRSIRLHGRDLRVDRVDVAPAAGEPVPGTYRQLDAIGNAEVEFAAELPSGRATLRFSYSAPLRLANEKPPGGVFRASIDGESYVFTRFQTTDARRALPSFDEPRFKIPYALTLRVPVGMRAAANTPLASSSVAPDAPDWQVLRFATTPPLPSYLLAWVVGPFDEIVAAPLAATPLRDRPVPLRALVAKGRGASAAALLAATPQVVTALERRLEQPYPFDKLDLVLVPDFSAGALENAALVLYREALVVPPVPTDSDADRQLLTVHAHELAHQWFGNLVTPMRWQDLWLSESFATWLADGVVGELRGERALTDSSRAARAALAADARAGVQAVVATAVADDDIPRLFDPVRYRKGAAVLAMLDAYLGSARMAEGVRRVIRRHAGSSVSSEEVVASLLEDVGVEAEPILRSYLERAGAPLLTLRSSCRSGRGELLVRQSITGLATEQSALTANWTVPFCYRTPAGRACSLLQNAEQRLSLDRCPEWLYGNADARGYYRVASDSAAMRATRLAAAALTAEERVAFVDDATALYLLGHSSFAALDEALALAVAVARDPRTDALERDAVLGAVLRVWESIEARWLTEPDDRRALAAVFAARLTGVRETLVAVPTLRQRWLRLQRSDPLQLALVDAGIAALRSDPATVTTAPASGALEAALADRTVDALPGWQQWLATPPATVSRQVLLNAVTDVPASAAAPLYERLLAGRLAGADVDVLLGALLRGRDRAAHGEWVLGHAETLQERGASPLSDLAPRLATALCSDGAVREVRKRLGVAHTAAAEMATCAAARRVQRRELNRLLAAAVLPAEDAVRDDPTLLMPTP